MITSPPFQAREGRLRGAEGEDRGHGGWLQNWTDTAPAGQGSFSHLLLHTAQGRDYYHLHFIDGKLSTETSMTYHQDLNPGQSCF